MGYTTDFEGQFDITPKLDAETHEFLKGLARTRRMQRKVDKKYGVQGEFFVPWNDLENFGQSDTPDVIDHNKPPETQPSLWLQWIPTDDGKNLKWNGAEKFYRYIEWLQYLIDKVFKPRGYTINGTVSWKGEDDSDIGKIIVKNNVIDVKGSNNR